MPTQTISLPEDLGYIVEEAIQSGRYRTTDEVIRAALENFPIHQDDDEAYLKDLRAAIDEGDASGIAEGDVFARVREKYGLPPRVL
jgi:putative addiction module CopG family antidote